MEGEEKVLKGVCLSRLRMLGNDSRVGYDWCWEYQFIYYLQRISVLWLIIYLSAKGKLKIAFLERTVGSEHADGVIRYANLIWDGSLIL